jgi:hypothetical protein
MEDAPGAGFPQAAGDPPRIRDLSCSPDGTMRAMHNRNQKDEYVIRDGKFTANGNPTPSLLNDCSEFSCGSQGNVPRNPMFNPRSTEEDSMKKFGYVIAALGAIAIAAPSIASAETVVIRHGDRDHHHFGARAEMHRDHGWRDHHDRKVVIIKHRNHGY